MEMRRENDTFDGILDDFDENSFTLDIPLYQLWRFRFVGDNRYLVLESLPRFNVILVSSGEIMGQPRMEKLKHLLVVNLLSSKPPRLIIDATVDTGTFPGNLLRTHAPPFNIADNPW